MDDDEGIREMLDYVVDAEPNNRFFASLDDGFSRYGNLSKKQYKCLCDAYWKIKAP